MQAPYSAAYNVAIKLKIPKTKGPGKGRFDMLPRDPIVRAALLAFMIVAIGIVGFFTYFYVKYDRIIEKRFSTPVFSSSAKI